jgi:hypothetical protein
MLETLERLIFDPISEAPPYQVVANAPLEVTGLRTPSPEGHGIFLVEHSYPRPEMQSTFASSRDSQGEARFGKPKFGNRKIPIKVYVSEATGVGAATNLATNPDGETVKKFMNGVDFAVTRELGNSVTAVSLSGEFRDKHAYGGVNTGETNMGFSHFAFPAAGTYCVSLFVFIPATWDGGTPTLSAEGYTGATTEKTVAADMNKRGQWQRIYTTVKVVAGDLVGDLFLRTSGKEPTSVGTGVVYSDAFQIESGVSPTSFLSGDTPGCYWNGKPHESTSTRVGSGQDRKRFIRSLYDLQEKIEKLADEGGTFKRVLPDGSSMVFDVVEATFVGEWDKAFNQGQQEFSFELICKPGARLQPIVLGAHEEKTLPVMKFTETTIPGNMPALGDLLIEDTQGVDRKFVAVAMASRFLDLSANADVFYEAENRLRLNSATLAAGSGVPSGSEANKVISCTLGTGFSSYLSTRSSAGVYMSHVGAHRVWARVWMPTTNKGEVSFRLDYAQGDLLRWRSLDSVSFILDSREGEWTLIDLGLVRLSAATIGAQRWEGRLAIKSTVVGDVAQVDWLGVLPAEEFYGEVRAMAVPPDTVGTSIASDNFSAAVNTPLAGATAILGGKWSGFGDADDFLESGGQSVYRYPSTVDVSGAGNDVAAGLAGAATGRYNRLGTGAQADVTVKCEVMPGWATVCSQRSGVFARWTDINNLVMCRIAKVFISTIVYQFHFQVFKKKAGAWVQLASSPLNINPSSVYRVTLHCASDGSGSALLSLGGTLFGSLMWVPDADLATGGVLATGGYGIHNTVAAAPSGSSESNYASFVGFEVFAGTETIQDAAIYAGRDLRVRWDRVLREASDGSGAFNDVGIYEGDRLLIPPSGREGRPVRFAILASRGQPEIEGDLQADDLKATLTITPRTIEVPEPE